MKVIHYFIVAFLYASSASSAVVITEIEECRKDKERYLFLEEDDVQCTDNYMLFESTARVQQPDQLKIGSFNIVRMGTHQSQFKRYDIVANIMNQWDLIGVVEIMATPAAYLKHNNEMDQIAKQFHTHRTSYNKQQNIDYRKVLSESYEMPGYLRLLKALREIDPSWSLILGPRPTGSTVTSMELGGFYYRAGAVENIPSNFCKGERGCSVDIPESVETLVPRLPFFATFQSGHLKFNAVALHLRWQSLPDLCGEGEKADRTLPSYRSNCLELNAEALEWVNEFSDVIRSGPRSRFIELAIIADQLHNTENEILMMGDFNLPFTPEGRTRNDLYWQRALNNDGRQVYVNEKTSISRLNGLANEYDHFVFDAKKLDRCDTSSATTYNFLLDLENPTTKEAPLKDLSRFLLRRQQSTVDLLEEFQLNVSATERLRSCDQAGCELRSRWTPSEEREKVDLYDHRILNTGENIPYKVFEDLISDHIPIHMTCSTR